MEIEPVGAAVFVDDEGHVGARRLHPHEEVDRRHRGRHEQDGPLDPGRRQGRREVDIGEVEGAQAATPRARRRTGGGLALRLASRARRVPASARRRCGRRSRGCGPCRADRRGSRRRPAGANGRRCGTASAGRRGSSRIDTATMSARGIITSSTRTLCRPSTFLSMARSRGEKRSRRSRASASASSMSSRSESRGRRWKTCRRRSYQGSRACGLASSGTGRGLGRAATSIVCHVSLSGMRRGRCTAAPDSVRDRGRGRRAGRSAADLERFHRVGIRLAGLVVLAEQVEGAMDEEVREVVAERLRLLAHFRAASCHTQERRRRAAPARRMGGLRRAPERTARWWACPCRARSG